jgi:porin
LGDRLVQYGLSGDLKDGLAALGIDRQNETGVEAFYNAALTPWLRLTADAQWVQPTTVGKDNAVFLGLRLQTLF